MACRFRRNIIRARSETIQEVAFRSVHKHHETGRRPRAINSYQPQPQKFRRVNARKEVRKTFGKTRVFRGSFRPKSFQTREASSKSPQTIFDNNERIESREVVSKNVTFVKRRRVNGTTTRLGRHKI